MNDTRFRVILPTSRKRSPPPPPLPRRTRVSSACDACRARKIRCNGGTPCMTCQKSDSICTYPNTDDVKKPTILRRENKVLREQVAAHQKILRHLRSVSPTIAQEIFEHLDTNSDPSCMLETIKTISSSPPIVTEKSPSPCYCTIATPSDQPITIPPIDICHTTDPTQTTLPSFQQTFSSCIPPFESSSQNPHSAALEFYPSPESLPEPQLQYSDPRLAQLDIGLWTTVPVSNAHAARAISSFLELEHPVGSVFRSIAGSSLFVRDLLDFQSEFCSELMVHALLAYASQGSDSLCPDAAECSYVFEKEAIREAQSISEDSLSAIIGLALIFMSISSHGHELEGFVYLSKAMEMALRMEVSGTQDGAKTLRRKSQDSRSATETAWSLCRMIV